MVDQGVRPEPLVKRGLVRRILKAIVVSLGFIFILSLIFLFWAFRTGRAVEAVREEIAVELDRRCGVEAEFTTLAVDPFKRELVLEQLSLRTIGGPQIIAVDEAIIRLDLLPLFYGRLQLDRVALLHPQARIEIVDGLPENLPDCVKPKGDSESAPIVLGISELTVERGAVALAIDRKVEIDVGDISMSLAPGPSGGVDIALGTDVGRIMVGGSTHTLSRVRVLGHLEGLLSRPRALVLDRVEVGVGRVTAAGSGSIDLLGPVFEANLAVNAPLDAVSDFAPSAPKMSGDASFDVSVAGTILNPRGAGRVRVKNAKIADFSLGDELNVDFAVDLRGAKLNEVQVRLGPGLVEATGSLAFDDALTFKVETQSTEVSLGRVLESVGVPGAWADLRADGPATIEGTLTPLELVGPFDYEIRNANVFDGAWDRPRLKDKSRIDLPPELVMIGVDRMHANGRWRFTETGLSFVDLVVSSGATVGNADVDVSFDSNGGMRIAASFPQLDFVDLGPIAGLPFGGFGSVSGELGGPYAGVRAAGTFELNDISIGGIPFGAGSGTVQWRDLVNLDVLGIHGRLGETAYSGQVGVKLEGAVPLVISGEISQGRVQDLLVPFGVDGSQWGDPTGKVLARFDLGGPVTELTGPIDMSIEDLAIYEETAQRGRIVGRMERGRIVVEDLDLVKHEGRIQGNGWFDPNRGNVRARIRTRTARLQSIDLIRGSQEHLDGKLDVNLRLDGSLMGVTGTLTAVLTDVTAGPEKLGNGRLTGQIRGGHVDVRGSILKDAVQVTGRVGLAAGIPYDAKLAFVDIPAPRIVSGLQNHQAYDGRITGTADLNGSLVDWHLSNGKVYVERGTLETESIRLETSAPARFTMKRGVLETRRLGISGPRTRLSGEGRFGANVIDMKVSGRVDLAIAEVLSPNVEKAGGTLVLDSTISGTPAAMGLVGAGRVERGLLKWAGFENRMTGMSADLTFSQSTVLIDRARGQWAGGQLDATGNVLLERFMPKRFTLNINASDVQPRMTFPKVDLAGRISGLVQMSGNMDHIAVRGDLDVRRGRARPKIDWQNLIGSRLIADVYDPSKEIVDFDILFHTKDNFRVKNDDADVELSGDLRLTGTNERYGMLGTATVVQGGRVAFIGREYTMQGGTIELSDRYRFAPKYDLIMSAQACQARIRLNVVGTFEDVQTSYSSNPEMDERDIVSCLIRGVKVTDLDRDLPSFAGSALLKLSGVDREVKKVLPIDQIDVTTEYSSQARAYEPRVIVAKDLSVLDRPARLEYSSSLLRTNDQRAALRVRLTPRLNVQFGWTSSEDVPYGDWGLDLKQRWEW